MISNIAMVWMPYWNNDLFYLGLNQYVELVTQEEQSALSTQ